MSSLLKIKKRSSYLLERFGQTLLFWSCFMILHVPFGLIRESAIGVSTLDRAQCLM